MLTVRTYTAGVSEAAAAAAPGARPGPCAVLAVADTGCGMTAEVKARIFEPFFTTKELGKGTGLGLATVYGVVEQSGGFIEFDSEPGHGTEFRIFLPRSKATDREIRTDEIRLGGAGGKETVLLVEDEDAVRALAALILRQAGYTVLQARDGREAVFLGEKHQGRIDLLLSDVVMPGGIGGGQVAQRLTGLRPGLKVLFMSGYTDDAMVRHGVLGSAAAFLQKPFTPPILTRKVREVLD
jgi:CheY-like chemotaxis protein